MKMKLLVAVQSDFSLKVSNHLNLPLADVEIGKFADGEIKIVINENVRQHHCYIIQPTGPSLNASPNDNFMELLILIDVLKEEVLRVLQL